MGISVKINNIFNLPTKDFITRVSDTGFSDYFQIKKKIKEITGIGDDNLYKLGDYKNNYMSLNTINKLNTIRKKL